MDSIFYLMIFALALLAVADLVVGVSNDAVNFLNSAIGSKAISFKKIMIIASLGVFIGAVFSSGMMEVARKGIFMPSKFYFDEIMFIFMAVMIGDILLLDFFNTLGMPTSTTVSIVFNLLGAAVVMALIKIGMSDTETAADLVNYINTEKAKQIISGILLSVVISFTVGMLVQWISRLVFSFQYEKKVKNFGFVFAGICLTAIGYFIFFKGLKGTPFYGDIKDFLAQNSFLVIGLMLAFWTLLMFIIDKVFKINVLIIVIGVGTFGLALAFAGNDLVNFIGVPMAAYHSYEAWSVSGIPASEFSMEILSEKVPTEPGLLFIAGAIMVVTLAFSKKARTVADTSIDLSRQGDGSERFQPNILSRSIVKGSTKLVSVISTILPAAVQTKITNSFQTPAIEISEEKAKALPAFDMIRASINLAVAGILISIATSMKLPLSTTYVTFMVAMGTSLADRAWGRESAVYRVAGVVNVIGGWFFTAFSAFTFAGILTYIIYMGRGAAVAILLLFAGVLVVRNYLSHKKKANAQSDHSSLKKSASQTVQGIIEESADNVAKSIYRTTSIFNGVVDGLSNQDTGALKKMRKRVGKFEDEVESLRNHLFYFIKNLDDTSVRGSNFYIMVLANLTDVVQSLEFIAKKSFKHIDNNHKPLSKSQISDLNEIQTTFDGMLVSVEQAFTSKSFGDLSTCLDQEDAILALISDKIDAQIARTRKEEVSPKNTTLYFNLLLETKDLVKAVMRLVEEYHNSSSNS
ncbi:inorganic phosphate transporter [Schleiferiaceae bacterium]|jgi:phosphate/sulfate permease|nr:inorganic phosphate transporter [Schleiferiaceae bacterium]PTL97019.1 MAG: phosphate:sodium symporter [Bacteroidota bacterium]MDA8582322.1 inorganic phosphate transporter [Schleiferiaceae bacterium]MDB0012980.1 inorganic phosphate transporter [Schleiferiaceae bacterium]MDB2627235.1 inorganic phosphate transporter [Schleiferiaceae bacterium]